MVIEKTGYCILATTLNISCKKSASRGQPARKALSYGENKIKVMVEVAGVEPASESTLTRPSPGADGYSGGLTPPVPFPDGKPSRASGQVSFMMCGTGKAYRTHIYR